MSRRKKGLVISLHGIRTRGEWQKNVSSVLGANDLIHAPLDYGNLRLPAFYWNALFDSKSEWFLREYSNVVNRHHDNIDLERLEGSPSIVAHSFGTLIVCRALERFPEIRVGRLVLCAAIVPEDFPWDKILGRGQVGRVRNEFGGRDIWASIARRLVPRCGSSGVSGFSCGSSSLVQEEFEGYRHSDFFGEQHVRTCWLPALRAQLKNWRVRHSSDLNDIGEFRRIIAQTLRIDEHHFGPLAFYAEVAPTIELAERWIDAERNLYTWVLDVDTDEYFGYLNALPVSMEHFETLIRAGIPDREVGPEVISPYSCGREIGLCAVSVAVAPGQQELGAGIAASHVRALLTGLCEKIGDAAKRHGTRVRSVGAVGWTPSGSRICEDLVGMVQVGVDRFGHPVYRLDINNATANSRFQPLRRVAQLYGEMGWI